MPDDSEDEADCRRIPKCANMFIRRFKRAGGSVFSLHGYVCIHPLVALFGLSLLDCDHDHVRWQELAMYCILTVSSAVWFKCDYTYL